MRYENEARVALASGCCRRRRRRRADDGNSIIHSGPL